MIDSTTAITGVDGRFGDSLGRVVEIAAEAVGVSTSVAELLPEARRSIIFGVGSGSRVFSISFMIQNSEWLA